MDIRKWAKPADIQRVLDLDSLSFENFKTHARNVHLELCKDEKRKWHNVSIEWGALPVEEKRFAISEVRSRCSQSGITFSTQSEKAIEEGIINRLHYHHKKRERAEKTKPQIMQSGLETTQSGSAALQTAPEAPKPGPFDPAVILNDP